MKKYLVITFFILLSCNITFALDTTVYSEKNKFGLIKGSEKITKAQYTKLIRLRDSSYICMYKGKFGIISNDGKILVEPKYTSAQRLIGKYAKLGYKGNYTLYDENANIILDGYEDISLLFGKMFLIKKNYKYGITSFNGDVIFEPVADDIYMPKPNILRISLSNQWFEITQHDKNVMEFPKEMELYKDKDFTIEKMVENPIISTGYGVVSASDYMMKLISSISPAYEETIDELILSHGVDTANILMKSTWIAKFPIVYAKNYFNTLKTPNNGPLSNIKSNLKNKIN